MNKKIILTLLLSVFCINVMVAQVKIVCSSPGIEVKYKRAFIHGNTATIHFTLTNFTGSDLNPFLNSSESTRAEVKKAEAYDDEGNYYDVDTQKMIVSIADAKISGRYDDKRFSFPNEVTVKGVVTIKNVDEYVTSITRIAIPFRYFNTVEPYGIGYIILKNIPLLRDL